MFDGLGISTIVHAGGEAGRRKEAGVIVVHVEVFFLDRVLQRLVEQGKSSWFLGQSSTAGCGADHQGFFPGQDSPAFRGAEPRNISLAWVWWRGSGGVNELLKEFHTFST